MRCPRCKDDNDRVVDSRTSAEGTVIRRRRECLSCFLRYTTYERIEEAALRVVKKSGERVSFDRDRILTGMLRACEKLPVPARLAHLNGRKGEADACSDGHRACSQMGALLICKFHRQLLG